MGSRLCQLRRRPALSGPLSLLLLIAGCGYTSQYTAPADGRVRPVWRENRVVVEPSGAQPPPACMSAALELSRTEVLRQPREYGVVRRSEGYWVPRYYGPPIIVISPRLAPVLPHPPLFLPLLRPPLLRPGVGLGGASVPSLRLGSSGDSGKALVFLAVIALVVLPTVDIALAAAPAESVGATVEAIDQVNALNDLLRSPGSPCDTGAGGAS